MGTRKNMLNDRTGTRFFQSVDFNKLDQGRIRLDLVKSLISYIY